MASAHSNFGFFTVQRVTTATAALLFCTLCLLPLAYMAWLALGTGSIESTISHVSQLASDPRVPILLRNSLILGLGTALVATAIGVPIGFLLARAPLVAKRWLRLCLIVPLVLPPYFLALAWSYFTGHAGLASRVLGFHSLSEWTYTLPAAILVLGVSFFPISMLATEAASRRVEAQLEEAALLHAFPRRVFWRITFPLVAPAVVAAALLIFVLALAEFGVPGLLRVNVFTTEILTAFAAFYDFARATLLAFPLLLIALLAAVPTKWLLGERLLTGRRSLRVGLPLRLGPWRNVANAGVIGAGGLLVLLPIAILTAEVASVTDLRAALVSSRAAIVNSLLLSILAASVITALGFFVGYARARARSARAGWADTIFIIAFAAPSTVVGVGLIGLWNRAGWPGEIYSSPAIVVLAYLARFLPVVALILAAGVRQVPHAHEEAAYVSGAGWLRTVVKITLPQTLPVIAAAWVVVFIFCLGELGATILLAPPQLPMLPTHVYTLIANAPPSQIASLVLTQAGIVLLPLVVFGMFVREPKERPS